MQYVESEPAREQRVSPAEIINPRKLPEAAFQSYQMLESNSAAVRPGFLANGPRNPTFLQSKLRTDLSSMDKGILSLDAARRQLDTTGTEPEILEVINSSLEYRMAEMEYVKLLGQLDYAVHELGDDELARELALQVKEMSERLYGVVDPEIRDMGLNMIWNNLDGKQYQGKAKQLYDDLCNGFTSAEGYEVGAMRRSDDSEVHFPDHKEATGWAGEYFQRKNADIFAIAEIFWDKKVAERGEGYVCTGKDMEDFLRDVVAMRDPENKAGILVKPKPKVGTLSWDSGTMTLYVGELFAERTVPINTHMILATRTLHEFGIHGQTAINGLKTDVPVLGMGLYTNTPSPDYLIFEEGFATVIESAIDGKQPDWTGGALNHYLNIAFAAEGDDFRTVFEKTWRYNLLQKVGPDEEITDAMIEAERHKAWQSCVRVFRGNPTDQGDKLGVVPTYNKDLAYLAGKVKAMKFIQYAYDQGKNTAYLDLALLGKADLTNLVQLEIALSAYERAGTFDRSRLALAA